jgi:MFS family permease
MHAFAALRRLAGGRGARLLLYMVTVTFCVNISGGYFNPYQLELLQLSYAEYVALTAIAYLARIVTLPAWGWFAHRYGAYRLLIVGGIGIVPSAALWALTDRFEWLIIFQLAAGAGWGAYELATLLSTFESIREDERTSVLALFNLGNAVTMATGAMVGAAIMSTFGTSRETYHALFLLSAGLRVLALLLLWKVGTAPLVVTPLEIRTVSLRPTSETPDPPILPSIGTPDDEPRRDL